TITPAGVDTAAVGVDYSWCDDSQLVEGIYFPEMATIYVNVSAQDTIPDYCDPNEGYYSWWFYIPDDDTIPPTFENPGPGFVSTRISFVPTIEIIDSSGVATEPGWAPMFIYDTDGELEISADTVAGQIDSCHTEGEVVRCFCSAVAPIGPYSDTCTVLIRVVACDDDHDFCRDDDRSCGDTTFEVPVLAGPQAEVVEPLPNTITACDDQEIIIHLWDPDGVDPSSVELRINDSTYTTDDPRLVYDDSLEQLVFSPGEGYFGNGEIVTVTLVSASDNLGNPMWDVLTWTFQVDLRAPEPQIVTPENGAMIRSSTPRIEVEITENLAGIDEGSLVMYINGVPYHPGEAGVEWHSGSPLEGMLVFDAQGAEVVFAPGDTVWVRVEVCDAPDYCAPNCGTGTWWFTIEPEVGCYIHPNPFSPDGDGVNEFVVFDYPRMYSESAVLHIFNLRNVEVYTHEIGPIDRYEEFDIRSWRGVDNDGNPVKPGLYMYVITAGGEVLCNGTVVVGR
ncbi:gliding motility-associated C-terminal domain-containing protein, partial [bacterium]|nr:gliding motility-associated C-terminal domain-containing protein [bacterium]